MALSMRSLRQPSHSGAVQARAQTPSSKEASPSARPTPKTDDMVPLGASDLNVSAVGLGTIAWGDPTQVCLHWSVRAT